MEELRARDESLIPSEITANECSLILTNTFDIYEYERNISNERRGNLTGVGNLDEEAEEAKEDSKTKRNLNRRRHSSIN